MSGDDVAAIAEEFGVPMVASAEEIELDPALVAELPVDWARSHASIPVRHGGNIVLLTTTPGETRAIEYVSLLIGEHLQPVVATSDLVRRCIQECYYSRESSTGDLIRNMGDGAGAGLGRRDVGGDLLQVVEAAPVTQLVNLLLLEAVKQGASDIHFEPFEHRLRVRYRIDGILYERPSPPKHIEDSVVSRLKVMGHMDIAEKRLPQDGTARVRVGEREIDIRVSSVPVAEGERVVLRLLNRESALFSLKDLGMDPVTHQRFEELLEAPNGMVIVSGPTGSGKTTTLYASLSRLDALHRNIMTVEDPIEYQLADIGQIQVNPKIGLTFAAGLRHILRQDPDMVLVGETRDLETAEIAVRAALTGHLVFTTLHTNDAASCIVRLVDMGMEPYLLASCVRGMLAQRLVRSLCIHCRRPAPPSAADIAALGDAARWMDGETTFEPVGCEKCLGGYTGRMGLFELLRISPELARRIRGGDESISSIGEIGVREGMVPLLADGLHKVGDGRTSLEEVLHAVG